MKLPTPAPLVTNIRFIEHAGNVLVPDVVSVATGQQRRQLSPITYHVSSIIHTTPSVHYQVHHHRYHWHRSRKKIIMDFVVVVVTERVAMSLGFDIVVVVVVAVAAAAAASNTIVFAVVEGVVFDVSVAPAVVSVVAAGSVVGD
mmetsp:Transcript_30545/g.34287  ORF Transcript_30545/g.34287 Transcript_30545/m.34287 type:complete len:144 (+) Transcript_30545:96-527(+)